MDISIVIPARGSELGLWSTMESCEYALEGQPLKYEFLLAANEPVMSDDFGKISRGSKAIAAFEHVREYKAPSVMRQMLMAKAKGRYIFLLDSHCQVSLTYFAHAVETFERFKCDVVHSAYRYWRSMGMHYEYHLNTDGNFWELPTYREPNKLAEAYYCASSGFGGVAIRRSTWEEIGGFCPELSAFGGTSEYCTDLTMWRMGYTVMLDPRMVHSHWAGERGYKRHYTRPWFEGWLMTGCVLGGPSLMHEWARTLSLLEQAPVDLDAIAMDCEQRVSEYRKWLDARASRTLPETLEYFAKENVRF
jgi:hypothetical protein